VPEKCPRLEFEPGLVLSWLRLTNQRPMGTLLVFRFADRRIQNCLDSDSCARTWRQKSGLEGGLALLPPETRQSTATWRLWVPRKCGAGRTFDRSFSQRRKVRSKGWASFIKALDVRTSSPQSPPEPEILPTVANPSGNRPEFAMERAKNMAKWGQACSQCSQAKAKQVHLVHPPMRNLRCTLYYTPLSGNQLITPATGACARRKCLGTNAIGW